MRVFLALIALALSAPPAFADQRAQPSGWKGAIAQFDPTTDQATPVNAYLATSLAALVYRPDNVILGWARDMGLRDVEVVRKKGKAMLLASTDRAVFIVVQGSGFNQRDVERACNAGYKKAFKGRVHKGGFNLSKELRGDAERYVKARRGRAVFVAGHSMGGLAAVFIGAHLHHHVRRSPRAVFTFGMPRMGNRTFRKNLDVTLHHFVNFGDGVAWLYPGNFHPNGHVWRYSAKGKLSRVKAPNKGSKKWLKEWRNGFKAMWKKGGKTSHLMPVYATHAYRQLTSAQKRGLFKPLQF